MAPAVELVFLYFCHASSVQNGNSETQFRLNGSPEQCAACSAFVQLFPMSHDSTPPLHFDEPPEKKRHPPCPFQNSNCWINDTALCYWAL